MHRIDADGHISGHWSEGNPTTGQLGTKVSAAWLEAVQEEICGLLTALGVVLDKAQNGQLAAALSSVQAGLDVTGPVGTNHAGVRGVGGSAGGAGVMGEGKAGAPGGIFGGSASGAGAIFQAGTTPGPNPTRGAVQLVPQGVPSAPENGDMWATAAGLFVRINGVTKSVTLT